MQADVIQRLNASCGKAQPNRWPWSTIYGVIGASGAGKSTLIRCVNLLEYFGDIGKFNHQLFIIV
ncbi:hypothetical protein D3M57_22580 [Klebsiella pneumoniae]|nr:hypothetical protein [Klebsiella pneumoniae]